MKSKCLQAGEWRVDQLAGEMSGPAGTRHLEPKVMEVLICLAENAGDVVTRDEILDHVWGNRADIADHSLTRCIKVLRHELGDSPAAPEYIKTVPKIGYALIAPVTDLEQEENDDETPPGQPDVPAPENETRSSRRKSYLLILTGAMVLLCVGWIVVRDPDSPMAWDKSWSERPAVAVLPFKAGTEASRSDYRAAGIADEVRHLLVQIPELRVAAGPSPELVASSDGNYIAIAELLGVQYILDGTLQREGTHIQAYVQLNNGADGTQLWSKKYAFESSGIFEIQTRIANNAVDALVDKLALPRKVSRFDVTEPTHSMEAYDYYLRGKQYLNLRTPPDLDKAEEMFEQAIAIDPDYGMAYVAMAYTKSLGPASRGMFETEDAFDESREILRLAKDRDPGIADAAQGIEAFMDLREGRLTSAYSGYRRSLDRFPSEPILHHGMSLLMSTVGHHDAALHHARIAHDLDRRSPIANGRLAVSHLWLDQNDSAEQYFHTSFDLGLDTVQIMQSYALLLLRAGKIDEARTIGRTLADELGMAMPWWDTFVAAVAGEIPREGVVRVLEDSRPFNEAPPAMQLGVWSILGTEDKAIRTLKRIFQTNPTSIGGFLFSSELARVRQDERFSDILAGSPIKRFWVEHGWSPHCSATPDDTVACK